MRSPPVIIPLRLEEHEYKRFLLHDAFLGLRSLETLKDKVLLLPFHRSIEQIGGRYIALSPLGQNQKRLPIQEERRWHPAFEYA